MDETQYESNAPSQNPDASTQSEVEAAKKDGGVEDVKEETKTEGTEEGGATA